MNYFIDKSKLSPEQLASYTEIIAKAATPIPEEEDEVDEEVEFEKNPVSETDVPDEPEEKVETKKSNPEAPEEKGENPIMKSALERLEALEKQTEMASFRQIAKSYAPLGEKEEELAETLYSLKKSDENAYKSYVAILDKSLQLIEKSGLFAEIGKSASGSSGSNGTGGAVAKAEAKATEIMKADPSIGYTEAIAKAWEDPTLMAEYDSEYFA